MCHLSLCGDDTMTKRRLRAAGTKHEVDAGALVHSPSSLRIQVL